MRFKISPSPLKTFAAFVLLSLAALRGQAAGPWPAGVPERFSQPIEDQAGMLSAGVVDRLTEVLTNAYAQGHGPQVAVLTIPSIGDRAIEDVGITVARGWGLGDKDRDDGVLLVIAKQEHKLRIEVGQKLEGSLTDIACKRIIEDVMVPRLRSGDVDGAVLAGVAHILDVVAPGSGLAVPPPPKQHWKAGPWTVLLMALTWFIILPFLFRLFAVWGLSNVIRRSGGSWGSGGGWRSSSRSGSYNNSGGGWGGGGGGFSGGGGGFSGGGSSGSW